MDASVEELSEFFGAVMPVLDERQRRVVAGAMAAGLGRGGKTAVAQASGMSRNTVTAGVREVDAGVEPSERVRAPGAGDKPAVEKQPGLLDALENLVASSTRGDPMSPLRWTLKSTYQLAVALGEQGFSVSAELVRRLLHQLGFSLRGNQKQIEGSHHQDRNTQFEYLDHMVAEFSEAGEPVISVDTKKKELIGNYANGGKEWVGKGEPTRVKVHDFADKTLGTRAKAIPYGIYDLTNNTGWVGVGDSADTSEFATNTIRTWWNTQGKNRFPNATRLLITADAGGSNGYRPRAWKWFLAKLAAETGLVITVVHYPPGTSKWNKIEHRLFSFISMNWRGQPLVDMATIIELISATTTNTGLSVAAHHDPNTYDRGLTFTKQQIDDLPLQRHTWHGDWNYTLTPT